VTYYPGWFDGVMGIAIVCGCVCFIAMKWLAAGRTRGLLKLAACLLMAIGLAFGGSGGVLFNSRAAHLTVDGTVSNVVIHTGKGSSTTFALTNAQGEFDGLHISSAKSQISSGEHAHIVYQAGSMVVLELSVLDGPGAGLTYSEGDGTTGAIFTLFIALVFAIYGIVNFISGGTGAPALYDNTPPSPGDADSKSIIDL
jgi:hypothetical protein